LNTLFLGKNFVLLPESESTNSAANALLESRPAEGTVIRAISQTAGRGQMGSNWHAQPGQNITISILFYPQFILARQVFLLNKLVACAVHETVAHLLPDAEILLKWPNDLLVNKQKVAGILIENQLERERIKSSIVGIGLNVNQLDFSPDLHGKASSLAKIAGREFDIEAVLTLLLEKMEARYLSLRSGKSEQIERDYLSKLYGYQEDVLAHWQGEEQLVHITGVAPDGRLALQKDGKLYFCDLKSIRFCL
jgi:BirA family biotin operon repressor/biotin-[acetyl-CoA-carboxylase] ligase